MCALRGHSKDPKCIFFKKNTIHTRNIHCLHIPGEEICFSSYSYLGAEREEGTRSRGS